MCMVLRSKIDCTLRFHRWFVRYFPFYTIWFDGNAYVLYRSTHNWFLGLRILPTTTMAPSCAIESALFASINGSYYYFYFISYQNRLLKYGLMWTWTRMWISKTVHGSKCACSFTTSRVELSWVIANVCLCAVTITACTVKQGTIVGYS